MNKNMTMKDIEKAAMDIEREVYYNLPQLGTGCVKSIESIKLEEDSFSGDVYLYINKIKTGITGKKAKELYKKISDINNDS